MHRMSAVWGVMLAVFVLALPAWGQDGTDSEGARDPGEGVVLIHATQRLPDYFRPWSRQPSSEVTGSGFLFDKGRILTNAHVVQYASRVLVQPRNSSERVAATVEYLSTPIDLAILRIDESDPNASAVLDRVPLELHDELPDVGSSVKVMGYPLDGDQLSVTEGVVSRTTFSSVSEGEMALVVQIDAAVNPGNSGGPAVQDGRVIGIVYARYTEADGVAFMLPVQEITEFLDEVELTGEYAGAPKIQHTYWPLQNASLREHLGVPAGAEGVVVSDSPVAAAGDLRPGDVITRIGEYPIDSGGNIELRRDLRVNFEYVLPEYEEDGHIALDILRDGDPMTVRAPVVRGWQRLIPFARGEYPTYFIHGPVVFTTPILSFVNERNALGLTLSDSPMAERVFDFPRQTEHGREELVVVFGFLTHPVTQGYQEPDLWTVRAINGTEIVNMRHLVETLRDLTDEWLVIDWADLDAPTTILPNRDMEMVTEELLEENGIRRRMSRELEPLWEP